MTRYIGTVFAGPEDGAEYITSEPSLMLTGWDQMCIPVPFYDQDRTDYTTRAVRVVLHYRFLPTECRADAVVGVWVLESRAPA